jgi:predicted acylesterase/phospholipase RssA
MKIPENINNTIESEIKDICEINKHKKTILVLPGGGMKGFILLGALKALEEKNILKDITTFAGTSIGGYLAILLVCGFTVNEIIQFGKLFDFSKSISIKIENLFDKFSIDNGEGFSVVFKKLLESKKINSNITLLELYKKTNKKVILCTTCLNTKEIIYVSYDNFPNLDILTAIRMTTAVPILFPPVLYDNKLYIDGGLLNNFPIDLFENNINDVIGIGIKGELTTVLEFKTLESYLLSVFDTLVLSWSLNSLKIEKYNKSMIIIPIPSNIDTSFDLSINLDYKKNMIDLGYEYVKSNIDSILHQNHN